MNVDNVNSNSKTNSSQVVSKFRKALHVRTPLILLQTQDPALVLGTLKKVLFETSSDKKKMEYHDHDQSNRQTARRICHEYDE